MRGHEALIAYRKNYKARPPYVIVCCGTDKWRGWKYWTLGGMPEVEIQPEDSIPSLDLRWAHGLTLAVIGESEDRVLEFFNEAEKVKPQKIYALMHWNNFVLESE